MRRVTILLSGNWLTLNPESTCVLSDEENVGVVVISDLRITPTGSVEVDLAFPDERG